MPPFPRKDVSRSLETAVEAAPFAGPPLLSSGFRQLPRMLRAPWLPRLSSSFAGPLPGAHCADTVQIAARVGALDD
jgi:hypothetical protein